MLHLDVHLMEMSPAVLLRTKARAVGFGLSLLSHPDCRTSPFAMGNEFNPAGRIKRELRLLLLLIPLPGIVPSWKMSSSMTKQVRNAKKG